MLNNSIFRLSASMSSLWQTSMQKNSCGAYLLGLSKWLLGYKKGFDNVASSQSLSSPLTVLLISIFWPIYHHLATQEVSFSCLWCWQCRVLHDLVRSEWSFRSDAAAAKRLSHKKGLGIRGKEHSNPKRSTSRPLLTSIAIGTRSLYSRFGESFFPYYFNGGIEIKH